MYAKTVTLGGTHWEQTNEILFRNRRIGCRCGLLPVLCMRVSPSLQGSVLSRLADLKNKQDDFVVVVDLIMQGGVRASRWTRLGIVGVIRSVFIESLPRTFSTCIETVASPQGALVY